MRGGAWARRVLSGVVCVVASGCLLPDLKKKPYEEGELGEGGMGRGSGRTGAGASATSSAAPRGGAWSNGTTSIGGTQNTATSGEAGTACTQTSCGGATPICSDDKVCVECSAGTKQCSGKTPQTCSIAGTWESQNACAQREICSNGACVKCPGTGGPTMVGLPLGYCIDSTEVTRSQYAEWLRSPDSEAPEQDPANCSLNTSFTPSGDWTSPTTDRPNHPVAYVDWCDAYAYCKWAGKRLCGSRDGGANPFDKFAEVQSSQWYAACTSNGENSYPYGSTYEPTKCRSQALRSEVAVEVGTMTGCTSTVSGYEGIYDLSGNVSEWEDSCTGPGSSASCQVRGGDFTEGDAFVMCGTQAPASRASKRVEFGFRCCAF